MDQTVNYINQEYKDHLKGFSFIKMNERNLIKKGYLIKAVNKKNLSLEIFAKIIDIGPNFNYIRTYCHFHRRYETIYTDNYYIFIQKCSTKKDKFKKSIIEFIKRNKQNIV